MHIDKFDILRFLMSTTMLVLLLVGLIIMLIYSYQKRRYAHNQTIDKLKTDHQKEILNTQLEIQESTFQHIAREIHDNINLSLTLAKLQLNTLCCDESSPITNVVSSSVGLIGNSINNLRDISRGLNSDIISSQGLVDAVKEEANRISASGLLEINVAVKGKSIFLLANKELVIFRIIQEAFNNILRHSNANEVFVTLKYGNSGLKISVIDDGIGFIFTSFSELANTGRSGFKNMEARTRVLNGTMQVNTKPGSGTKLLFYIPYK